MSDYFDPEAQAASNQSHDPAPEPLPLPPRSGTTGHGPAPRPERVRHVLYGSLAAIDRTIKILHAVGYTDPNDWSDPTPIPPASGAPGGGENRSSSGVETWMAIATKTVLIE